jgi:hypothetical protein
MTEQNETRRQANAAYTKTFHAAFQTLARERGGVTAKTREGITREAQAAAKHAYADVMRHDEPDEQSCLRCNGSGHFLNDICYRCAGKGYQTRQDLTRNWGHDINVNNAVRA